MSLDSPITSFPDAAYRDKIEPFPSGVVEADWIRKANAKNIGWRISLVRGSQGNLLCDSLTARSECE